MKHDAVTMTLLYDFYGQLLTDKQRICFDLYYNQDFSLAEIAEEEGISRQGVHDSLARAEVALSRFERQVGCIARAKEHQKSLETIRNAAKILAGKDDGETNALATVILTAADNIKE